jgi:uncharacterized membrane protein
MKVMNITPIPAAADVVWAVMSDVARWPEWTASITSVERLDDGPFTVGSRAKVRQPGFPAVVWTVTELDEGRSFTWQARSPGVVSTGFHAVRAVPGGCEAELGLTQTGALAPLMRLLFGRRTRRFVQMEADGLRGRSISQVSAGD